MNLRRIKYFVLNKLSLLLIGIIITSCSTIRVDRFEVLQPAEVVFPTHHKKVALVSNAAIQPKESGHSSYIEKQYRRRNKRKYLGKDTVELDSLTFAVMYNMANELNKSSFFDTVVVHKNHLAHSKPFYDSKKLSKSKLQKVSTAENVEGIVSLDAFIFESNLIRPEIFRGEFGDHFLEVSFQALTRVYDGKSGDLIQNFLISDTLYWYKYENGLRELPSREAAISEAAWYAGELISKKLVPTPLEVERYYYTGGNYYLRKGSRFFDLGQLEKAKYNWLFLFNLSTKKMLKSRVSVNLALVYEKQGELKEALRWINEAIENSPQISEFNKHEISYFYQYKKVLLKRLEQEKKLLKQYRGI